jgi:hypothetical protein
MVTIASPPKRATDDPSRPSADGISAPMRELLIWVARCPRTYADAMDAWQSHCPRFTVWEDALAAQLIQIVLCGSAVGDARVQLTSRGSSMLAGG